MTVVIYLIGRSGTGKYTIAKKIAKDGYKIVDNHHINNPILSLLEGVKVVPEYAWDAIRQVKKGVFEFIANERSGNFILTNELFDDNPLAWDTYKRVLEVASRRGSAFVPVKLTISPEENIKRIAEPDRALRYKALGINEANLQRDLVKVSHDNLLEINVSFLTAEEAAMQILQHVSSVREQPLRSKAPKDK